MTDSNDQGLSRRGFVQGTVAGAALAVAPGAFAAGSGQNSDRDAVLAQVPKMHAENVKRLQDWIALPSIAAENRNYPQGAEYMAKLAEQAGSGDEAARLRRRIALVSGAAPASAPSP